MADEETVVDEAEEVVVEEEVVEEAPAQSDPEPVSDELPYAGVAPLPPRPNSVHRAPIASE